MKPHLSASPSLEETLPASHLVWFVCFYQLGVFLPVSKRHALPAAFDVYFWTSPLDVLNDKCVLSSPRAPPPRPTHLPVQCNHCDHRLRYYLIFINMSTYE